MLRNILLITYRNLIKTRVFTLINIVGLAFGIGAFVIISAYVHFERSYDRQHPDYANIYRVESQFYKGENLNDDWATSTNGYASAMKDNMPEIASFTRINWNNSERVVKYNDVKFREEHVCFADSNFFQFFAYPLVKGNAATVLRDANTLVLSESAARKYFGNADPIGKFMEISTLSNSYKCMVTGVFRDLPANSTMKFNFLVSWMTCSKFLRDFWYIHESYTFVKLSPGAAASTVEAKFPAMAERYKTGLSLKDLRWEVRLVPLADMHLNPAKPNEIEAKGNRNAVNFLNIMAFVILGIACINYINLSTARAAERAREVGIRKVSGAHHIQLTLQFLLEAMIINVAALLLSFFLVAGAIYFLPSLTGSTAAESLLFDRPLLLQVAAVLFAGMLLSGLYPAVVLAGIQPVKVLKGRFSFSKRGVLLRKSMVAFQFTASLFLIAGTDAIYRQLNYMSNVSTGINISQTIVIKAPVKTTGYQSKLQGFKNALQGSQGVRAVTASGAIPGKEIGEFAADRRFGAPKTEEHLYEMLRVDHDFIKTYGLQVIAGRAFDRARASDSTGVILNEAAVRQFGFDSAENAIGKTVWLETLDKKPNEVIGVIKNYHQQSLQKDFTPVVLFMDPALGWVPTKYLSIKINTGNARQLVDQIKGTWNNFFPESSFDFFFLDDFYNRQYQQETQFGHVFMLFSSLAIIIACMGLFGLTAYSTARRTREIGVRKVLGASTRSIMSILIFDTVRLILLCSIIAIPAAYWLITQWLQHYAFRVSLNWWQFAVPVVTLVIIALATISYLTFKAALTNPATTLKDE